MTTTSMTELLDKAEALARYEAVTQDGYAGWLCRRCKLVVLEARMGAAGPTWKGVTLADLVESASEHEQESHSSATGGENAEAGPLTEVRDDEKGNGDEH